MNIIASLLSGSFPFKSIFKILLIFAVAAAIFSGGVYVGDLRTAESMQTQIDDAKKETSDLRAEYNAAKNQWLVEKATAAVEAAKVLSKSIEDARAKEAAAQAEIARINSNWASKVKRIRDDAQAALDRVLHPVVTADPVSDGMWVDAYSCSGTTTDASGPNGVPQAGGGTADAPLRCRLHSSTAERLIQRAAEANKVVVDYNACVNSLKVLSPASFPISP